MADRKAITPGITLAIFHTSYDQIYRLSDIKLKTVFEAHFRLNGRWERQIRDGTWRNLERGPNRRASLKFVEDDCLPLPDAAHYARRLVRAYNICRSIMQAFADDVTNEVDKILCTDKQSSRRRVNIDSALLELGTFSWRPCCNFTKTRACREACLRATSQQNIESHCSRGTEDAKLYECIDRQKDGEKCCGKAMTSDGLTCKATCWHMYMTNTLVSSDGKRRLRQQCTGPNRDVVSCLQKQTRTTRQSNHIDSVNCCEATNNATCKTVCIDALGSDRRQEEKLDIIIEACGKANPMEPLYQCLLKDPSRSAYSVKDHDIAGIDSAKLHCCEKATSKRCNSLCVKTHSKRWFSISKFENTCGYLSSPLPAMETQMHGCLRDVDEPCQLGCSGLGFCTNMNGRPMEHFRSCNADADTAARNDILLWQKGFISLPSLQIPVKDIRSCEPEMWKAIACAYQIKPCFKAPLRPQICQEDCVYILNKCVDTSRLKGQMVTDLCNRLPKTSSNSCISVRDYTTEGPHQSSALQGGQPQLTHSCSPNPCKRDEICIIYRRKCHHSDNCPHFVCRKACKLGQVSKVMVPVNTHVVVPVYKGSEGSGSGGCQHYKVCHCGHSGNLAGCHDMRCTRKDHCVVSNGVVKSHGEYFKSECNDCVCFGGKTICTRRQCTTPVMTNPNKFTDIQGCDCSARYDPVCATNGKTYPSACVAQCAGQSVSHRGSCFSQDPCMDSPCEAGYRCVVHRQVCLGQKNSLCVQFKCVELSQCNRHLHEPVCDTNGVEHTNDCMLLSKGRTLAYRGHCQAQPCQMEGIVCGHNGETYPNECTAQADRTTVDYKGPCTTFSRDIVSVDAESAKSLCEDVVCKPVVPTGCKGIIPPWSCCPVCAAELRMLTSESLINTVAQAVRQGPVTLGKILDSLSGMVSISECDVFGYLGLDRDIVMMIAPVSQKPTSLQVNACIKEAERFEYLINSRSPTISSNMLTHSLLYAPIRTPKMTLYLSGASKPSYTLCGSVVLTVLMLHYSHKILGIL